MQELLAPELPQVSVEEAQEREEPRREHEEKETGIGQGQAEETQVDPVPQTLPHKHPAVDDVGGDAEEFQRRKNSHEQQTFHLLPCRFVHQILWIVANDEYFPWWRVAGEVVGRVNNGVVV